MSIVVTTMKFTAERCQIVQGVMANCIIEWIFVRVSKGEKGMISLWSFNMIGIPHYLNSVYIVVIYFMTYLEYEMNLILASLLDFYCCQDGTAWDLLIAVVSFNNCQNWQSEMMFTLASLTSLCQTVWLNNSANENWNGNIAPNEEQNVTLRIMNTTQF